MRRSLLLLCIPATAHAGGQLIGDNGAAATQRAGAFVATADDPSALWWNPAGFAEQAPAVFVGANVIDYQASFQRAGSYQDGTPFPVVQNQASPQPVPMVAAGVRAGAFGIGFGVMAPHGDGRRVFPTKMGDAPAPQRYDTIDQQALIVFPSIAAAVQASPVLSLGVRASVGYASLASTKAVQGVANGSEDPADDSIVSVDARDTRVLSLAAGALWHASPDVAIGVSYTAPVHVHAVGTSANQLGSALQEPLPGMPDFTEPVAANDVRCAPGGSRDALATCISMTIPQTATAGARYAVRDDDGLEIGDVEMDVRWENWAHASDTTVVVDGQDHLLGTRLADSVVKHGLRDTWSVRLGGAGAVGAWQVRAGVAYETAAAPDSWTRLDLDGNAHMTAGAGVGVTTGGWRIDLGGALIAEPRRNLRDVPMTEGQARVQPDIQVPLDTPDHQPYNPFNAGSYEGSYWIASLGLTRSL